MGKCHQNKRQQQKDKQQKDNRQQKDNQTVKEKEQNWRAHAAACACLLANQIEAIFAYAQNYIRTIYISQSKTSKNQ